MATTAAEVMSCLQAFFVEFTPWVARQALVLWPLTAPARGLAVPSSIPAFTFTLLKARGTGLSLCREKKA